MADLATLIVRLVGDATKYQETLRSAETDTTGFASRATSGLAKIGGSIVTGAAWAAGAAFTGMGFLIKGAMDEALSAEEIMAQLNSTLANTGPITGVTGSMVAQLAEHYQSLTRFEDDQITAGGEVLARFQQINSTAFPDAIRLSLDLATKWKTDVPTAAGILGKALADPGVGLMKLKSAGVVFTDAQDKMIAKMTEAGDVAGAQAIIMDVVNKTVGGAAEAAGKTGAGVWERLKNIWGNTLEVVGTGLIPGLVKLGETMTTWLSKPEVQASIERIAQGIANFATQVITNLPLVVQWFKNAFGWLQENQGVIVAALAVIGVAIAAWVFTVVIPAAIAMISAMWPVLLVMAAVAAIAYLVYQAWTQNWGGIQEKTAAAVEFVKNAVDVGFNFVKNIIDGVMQFIENLTSGKLGVFSELWNNTINFVSTYINNAIAIWKAVFAAFHAAMTGDWYTFGAKIREIVDLMLNTLGSLFSTAWENTKLIFSGMVTSIVNFFKDTNWGEVGRNIIQGIANGITNSLSWIMDAARRAANAALQAAMGFLGIHSPSRVFEMQVGWQMAAGMAKGWTRGVGDMMPGTMQGIVPAIGTMPGLSAAGSASTSARSGSIQITVENRPLLSLGDRYEVDQILKPLLQSMLRELGVEVNR